MKLIGNEALRKRILQAADEDRLHPCYILEGPVGIGKASFALELALYVNCLSDGPRPCRACRACRPILAGTHPDVLMIGCDPERTARVISADQARGILAALQLQRVSAKRRFVILDPADALNEEAANALLKTLEEPPPHTQFLLVTARAASLLPTIRSRSQRARFTPIQDREMLAFLAEKGLPSSLLQAAQGSPGLALRLAAGEGEARASLAAALIEVPGQPLHKLFAFTEAQGKKAEKSDKTEKGEKEEEATSPVALTLDLLEELLRDAVLLAQGRQEGLFHPALAPQVGRWGRALWPEGIGRMERGLALARERAALNVNGRVILEALLTQLNLELSQLRD